jgi:hypothetical protein
MEFFLQCGWLVISEYEIFNQNTAFKYSTLQSRISKIKAERTIQNLVFIYLRTSHVEAGRREIFEMTIKLNFFL